MVSRVYYFKNRDPESKEFIREKEKVSVALSSLASTFPVYFRTQRVR